MLCNAVTMTRDTIRRGSRYCLTPWMMLKNTFFPDEHLGGGGNVTTPKTAKIRLVSMYPAGLKGGNGECCGSKK